VHWHDFKDCEHRQIKISICALSNSNHDKKLLVILSVTLYSGAAGIARLGVAFCILSDHVARMH